jgi:DNA-binding response OmpR family regulator
MIPKTLALVDDDAEFAQFLSRYLAERGTTVDIFGDSNDLLTHGQPYAYDFYVLDLTLPGIDGVDLIKVLRRRTSAGILVVSGRVAPDVFERAVGAGADMYLAKPVSFEQVTVAIEAVLRRSGVAAPSTTPWRLDRGARQLVAPDGARVDLGVGHLAMLECFVAAAGQVVTREALRHTLGQEPGADAVDNLNSSIFRLRRRIERATTAAMPLQAKSGVGYVFRAPLEVL